MQGFSRVGCGAATILYSASSFPRAGYRSLCGRRMKGTNFAMTPSLTFSTLADSVLAEGSKGRFVTLIVPPVFAFRARGLE